MRRAPPRRRSWPAIISGRCTAFRSRSRICTRPAASPRPTARRSIADWVPDFDAAAVERLKRAGAVLLGKTNLHELAYGTTSANAHYGAVHNPWRLDHHPGGSSGGSSAAVAAGLGLRRDGQRHRRLDPPAGGVLRHRRHQADLRPGQQVRRAAAVLVAGSRRPADPERARRGAAARRCWRATIRAIRPSVERPVPDFSGRARQGRRGPRIGVVRGFFFEDCDPEVVGRGRGGDRGARGPGRPDRGDRCWPDMDGRLSPSA